VEQRTSGPPVTVGERVDGLELGMNDRRLDQRRDVESTRESDQIRDPVLDAIVARWDECGLVGPVSRPADPHLLGAPFPSMLGVGFVEHRGMHGEDRCGSVLLREFDRGVHGSDIAGHYSRVCA
jgi:hypothetical protein